MNAITTAAPDLSGQDQLRPDVTWIAVDAAASLFTEAKMPRNPRTIRRYCMRGDLECRKTENALHQPQYFISKASVETYIEQQRTLLAGRPDMSGQSQTESDVSGQPTFDESTNGPRDASLDRPGHVQTNPDRTGHDRTQAHGAWRTPDVSGGAIVDQLEARIKDKDEEIAFLRSELLHRRTTDTALHDVIAAFRANAEMQRLAAAPQQPPQRHWPGREPRQSSETPLHHDDPAPGTGEPDSFAA